MLFADDFALDQGFGEGAEHKRVGKGHREDCKRVGTIEFGAQEAGHDGKGAERENELRPAAHHQPGNAAGSAGGKRFPVRHLFSAEMALRVSRSPRA